MKRLHFDSCTSTNDMLKKEHGDLLAAVAEEQTAGRGQRGNSWYSEAGRNLLFSVLTEPRGVLASEAFILSQAMALAIARTLEKRLPERGVRIKWPNDIYVAGCKVCGILIENDLQGKRLVRSIIGCGINVNQTRFPDGLAVPATSLALETGKEEDRERLLDEVLSAFEALYRRLCDGQYEDIRRDYHERLYLRGERRRFEDASGVFEGCISHVEHDGHLIIEDAGGEARRYAFKEVKVKQ